MSDIKPDNIYSSPLDKVSEFAFDEAVARVFPDMIQRSVPGYTTIIPMIGIIAEEFGKNDTYAYDLGCSLGASTLAMRHGLKNTNCKIIGVDNSASMIDRCSHYIELDNTPTPVELRCADIRELDFEPSSLITLNFTLQFLPESDRPILLEKMANALIDGGALILSEKLRFNDTQEHDTLDALHLDFKRANGYSELEISQKRSALDNVLVPETLDSHLDRLKQAGFSQAHLWYQCFNFVSILAVK